VSMALTNPQTFGLCVRGSSPPESVSRI